jgi:anaerobic selenocysteine-containing dehydrogenase
VGERLLLSWRSRGIRGGRAHGPGGPPWRRGSGVTRGAWQKPFAGRQTQALWFQGPRITGHHEGVNGYDSDEFGGSSDLRWANYKPFTDRPQKIAYDEYKSFLEKYTPEYAEEVSGVPADRIREIARLLADQKRKSLSFWTMGFNQHSRGT